MTAEEQRVLLAPALLAAFAHGNEAEAEREEVRGIATTPAARPPGWKFLR